MEQSVLTNIDNNISRTNTEQLHNQKKNSLSHALANFTLSSTSIDVRVTPVHSPIQVLLVFIYYLFIVFKFCINIGTLANPLVGRYIQVPLYIYILLILFAR